MAAELAVIVTGSPSTVPGNTAATLITTRLAVVTDPAPVDTVAWVDFDGRTRPSGVFEGK